MPSFGMGGPILALVAQMWLENTTRSHLVGVTFPVQWRGLDSKSVFAAKNADYCNVINQSTWLRSCVRPVKSHALRVWHTQLTPFTQLHANRISLKHFCSCLEPGYDMARIFPSSRDRRVKMPRILGHYLLYNNSSTARCGPASVTVHTLLVSRARNCIG